MMHESTILEAHSLCKTYGRGAHMVRAVVSADIQVDRGQIVGIAGRSGSGKSTLLRLLAGLELPTAGRVELGGRPAYEHARVGYVMPIFQDAVASLDPRWPIWRTITEPLTAPHLPERHSERQLREIARERLAAIGLSAIDPASRPGELSGGQCQRVSILRSLIARPALLIADEPTSGLDPSVAAGILHLLRSSADTGTAMVIVSHDQNALAVLCDRVLCMSDGVLTATPGLAPAR